MTDAVASPGDRLQLRRSADGEIAVLTLDGELDPHTSPWLQEQADEIEVSQGKVVALDMSGLRFVDSSGLRVIVNLYRRLDEAGARLVVRNASDNIQRLLDLTGLWDLLRES